MQVLTHKDYDFVNTLLYLEHNVKLLRCKFCHKTAVELKDIASCVEVREERLQKRCYERLEKGAQKGKYDLMRCNMPIGFPSNKL
jgi:hypothetical protein